MLLTSGRIALLLSYKDMSRMCELGAVGAKITTVSPWKKVNLCSFQQATCLENCGKGCRTVS